jgi:nucleotide-binding universal stress UspA family protein
MQVVLGLDGSDHATVARDLVAGLPWPAGTIVHVVAAYQLPRDDALQLYVAAVHADHVARDIRQRVEVNVAVQAAALGKAGLAIDLHIVNRRPANSIINVAKRVGADLIVTGSRGRGTVRSMLLGSVATEVATSASTPVLVARTTTARRLVVAVDGSPSALALPQRIVDWKLFRESAADVVAVGPLWLDWAPMLETDANGGSEVMSTAVKRRAEGYASAASEQLRAAGISADAQIRSGHPAEEIISAAQEASADLIVMGSRDLRGIKTVLLGSVARNVLAHAECSVLVMRGM